MRSLRPGLALNKSRIAVYRAFNRCHYFLPRIKISFNSDRAQNFKSIWPRQRESVLFRECFLIESPKPCLITISSKLRRSAYVVMKSERTRRRLDSCTGRVAGTGTMLRRSKSPRNINHPGLNTPFLRSRRWVRLRRRPSMSSFSLVAARSMQRMGYYARRAFIELRVCAIVQWMIIKTHRQPLSLVYPRHGAVTK